MVASARVCHAALSTSSADDRFLIAQPIHGGVIACLDAHEQIGKGLDRRHSGEKLAQHGGRQLASATAAMSQRSQARLVISHVRISMLADS